MVHAVERKARLMIAQAVFDPVVTRREMTGKTDVYGGTDQKWSRRSGSCQACKGLPWLEDRAE